MPNSDTSFVHVVGSVNTSDGTGQFLFVTPSKSVPSQNASGAMPPDAQSDIELIIEDAAGSLLARIPLSILRASDHDSSPDALIDEMVPAQDGMARLKLVHKGSEIAKYEAGSEPIQPPAGLALGMAPPGSANKRPMSLDAEVNPEPGVTYSIQVLTEGERLWQTIALGLEVPDVTLDRNQFPDSETALVRIVRTNGFTESVVAEDTVELKD